MTVFSETEPKIPKQSDGTSNWIDGSGGRITNLSELRWLSENQDAWDETWTLENDIDATETIDWNDSKGFNPIGDDSTFFSGNFIGNYHKITNLFIDRDKNIGLFGFCMNSVIRDLNVLDVNFRGDECIGGLAGVTRGLNSIINCGTSGLIEVNTRSAGGLIGKTMGVKEVTSSYSNTIIRGDTAYSIAGLISETYKCGPISNSYSLSMVTGHSEITGCISRAFRLPIIVNSYHAGIVHAYSYSKFGFSTADYRDRNNKKISNCYFDSDMSECEPILEAEDYSVASRTTEEFGQKDYFINWKFGKDSANPWIENEGGRPFLYWQKLFVSSYKINGDTIQTKVAENGTKLTECGLRFALKNEFPIQWKYYQMDNTPGKKYFTIPNDIPPGYYYVQPYATDGNHLATGETQLYTKGGNKYSGGNGSMKEPYIISTKEDLLLLSNSEDDWGLFYLLVNDIEFDKYGEDWNLDGDFSNDTTGFSPIGTTKKPFTGSLMGWDMDNNKAKNHTISNLKLVLPEYIKNSKFKIFDKMSWGLFGDFAGGVLHGINVENIELTDYYHDSYVIDVGGLCGINRSKIINCSTSGNITIKSSDMNRYLFIGGLVGTNQDTIYNSSSSVNVVSTASLGGGLCGKNGGVIVNSYAKGAVITTGSTRHKGGSFCGGCEYDNSEYYALQGIIAWSYTSGDSYVEHSPYFSGGIVGHINFEFPSGHIIYQCYFDYNTCGTDEVVPNSNTKLLSTNQFGDASNFEGFIFGNVLDKPWKMTSADRPFLYWQEAGVTNSRPINNKLNYKYFSDKEISKFGCIYRKFDRDTLLPFNWERYTSTTKNTINIANLNLDKDSDYILQTYIYDGKHYTYGDAITISTKYSGGSGQKTNPYIIKTKEELVSIAHNQEDWSSFFKLDNNIKFSTNPKKEDWNLDGKVDDNDSLGYMPIAMEGSYEGAKMFRGGFDGSLYTISNLFMNRTVESKDDNYHDYHGLFGRCYNARLKNIIIKDCDLTGVLLGGLVGYAQWCHIEKCGVEGKVGNRITGKGSHCVAGGLVGLLQDVFYKNIPKYFTNIENCYTIADITSLEGGGFVGCYHSALYREDPSLYLTNCYSASDWLSHDNQNAYYYGLMTVFDIEVKDTDSFYDIQVEPFANVNNAYGSALQTHEMKKKNTYTSAGWDFEHIWDIDGETLDGYPFLRKNLLAVEDNKSDTYNQTEIFPNPAETFIYIRSTKKVDRVEIYSYSGELVLETKSKTIDISDLNHGIFYVKIYSIDDTIEQNKFIKL